MILKKKMEIAFWLFAKGKAMVASVFLLFCMVNVVHAQSRKVIDFNTDWFFRLDSVMEYRDSDVDYRDWRSLALPHDWSIELPFDSLSAGSSGTGYLPGGVGWYKKSFILPATENSKQVYVLFDGIYENSEVWINDVYLGHRPNGYVPIIYDLTKHLRKNGENNVMTVKVDNSKQPNSRFYAGSGIYRPVKLIFTEHVAIAHQGTFFTTPVIEEDNARVNAQLEIENHTGETQREVSVEIQVYDAEDNLVVEIETQEVDLKRGVTAVTQDLSISAPKLWSPDRPTLYKAVTLLRQGEQELDRYETVFGIRSFVFDEEQGFSLNGVPMKIRGVCLHSDLGALGMAYNRSAARRQLQIMKNMGVNGIRMAHNPPASEFLDLCDEMGFIVMNETFDVWKQAKNPYDYHRYWDEWYARDFADHIKRDRNHPSLFVWCLGNEVQEQWHSPELGKEIPLRLAAIVDSLDGTRPTTIANNETSKNNPVLMTPASDIVGYNYNHQKWTDFAVDNPDRKFIVTESTSALASRGQYDLISTDSIRMWPIRWDIPFDEGNADKSISAYDHVHTPWGSTHEESLRILESHPHISGMYVWTGFDYLGEPTPYTWPARSSYFGIVDLAGFPKDVYYLYQSLWTETPVLHVLPHWNWKQGDVVDVVVYYNQADEVELLVNGISQGRRAKEADKLHVKWTVPYQSGTLTAVAYQDGVEMRRADRHTAGEAVCLEIKSVTDTLHYTQDELVFLEIVALDRQGNECPLFNDEVELFVKGKGQLMAMDNGNPVDLTPFNSSRRNAYNGKLLAIIKGKEQNCLRVEARTKGLKKGVKYVRIR